jgi:hypothetical protein
MGHPTLKMIREGVAANLMEVFGDSWQVSPYMLSNPTTPSMHTIPDPVEYDGAMQRGMDTWTLIVQAFVGLASDIAAQMLLDELLEPSGPGSLKAAIEAEPTLGGRVDDLHVTRASGYKVFVLEGRAGVLGCDWEVTIIAKGA